MCIIIQYIIHTSILDGIMYNVYNVTSGSCDSRCITGIICIILHASIV